MVFSERGSPTPLPTTFGKLIQWEVRWGRYDWQLLQNDPNNSQAGPISNVNETDMDVFGYPVALGVELNDCGVTNERVAQLSQMQR